jgi:predicted nuclease of predicted toxin-antitoxin system
MKFKLDECVDARLSMVLKQAGYETVTAHQQGLHGIEDKKLYHLCMDEGYILVTLDIHFSRAEILSRKAKIRRHQELISDPIIQGIRRGCCD